MVEPTSDGPFHWSCRPTGSGPRSHPSERARTLAQAGHLVALPTFPLTSGDGAEFTDYVNQPADISFVIDTVRPEAQTPTTPGGPGRRRTHRARRALAGVPVERARRGDRPLRRMHRVDLRRDRVCRLRRPVPNGTLDDPSRHRSTRNSRPPRRLHFDHTGEAVYEAAPTPPSSATPPARRRQHDRHGQPPLRPSRRRHRRRDDGRVPRPLPPRRRRGARYAGSGAPRSEHATLHAKALLTRWSTDPRGSSPVREIRGRHLVATSPLLLRCCAPAQPSGETWAVVEIRRAVPDDRGRHTGLYIASWNAGFGDSSACVGRLPSLRLAGGGIVGHAPSRGRLPRLRARVGFVGVGPSRPGRPRWSSSYLRRRRRALESRHRPMPHGPCDWCSAEVVVPAILWTPADTSEAKPSTGLQVGVAPPQQARRE